MPTISVILPTYDPDPTRLRRMTDSVLAQSFRDFELIMVDDGSRDEQRGEIEKIAALDSRIRLLRQENSGVSRARNTGIAEAKGEYLAFADDDDVMSPWFLEEALEILKRENCDIVLGGVVQRPGEEYDFTPGDGGTGVDLLRGQEIREYQKDLLIHVRKISHGGYINRGPVGKLVRRSLGDVTFPEDVKYGEDYVWNQKILSRAQTVAVADRIWYLYILREGSASTVCAPDAAEQAEMAIEAVQPYIAPDAEKEFAEFIFHKLYGVCVRWFNHKDCPLTEEQKVRELKSMAKRSPWNVLCTRKYMDSAGFKRKMLCALFKTGLLSAYWKLKKPKTWI